MLSETEIDNVLPDLPGWTRTTIGTASALTRCLTFQTFPLLIEAVNRIATVAEQANHHPDLDIRYTTLKVYLTSHDAGGITGRDVRMAKKISEILS
jgi:4a-hydroxytetrahydrobiopterin dehydratase